jgi:hypothetical protein
MLFAGWRGGSGVWLAGRMGRAGHTRNAGQAAAAACP